MNFAQCNCFMQSPESTKDNLSTTMPLNTGWHVFRLNLWHEQIFNEKHKWTLYEYEINH